MFETIIVIEVVALINALYIENILKKKIKSLQYRIIK